MIHSCNFLRVLLCLQTTSEPVSGTLFTHARAQSSKHVDDGMSDVFLETWAKNLRNALRGNRTLLDVGSSRDQRQLSHYLKAMTFYPSQEKENRDAQLNR